MDLKAFVVDQAREPLGAVELLSLDELEGDVTIEVAWSGVNFKDAMVTLANNRVARRSRLVVGVDLAGKVVDPGTSAFKVGDDVLAHAYGLGVSHHGGFATMAKVPTNWVVQLPAGLDARSAMAVGTAGFTAAASFERLELEGLTPADGPVLVTGATGGVGSWAVALLAARGYEVVASSGKAAAEEHLVALGAARVIGRDEIDDRPERVLGSERWAGAIDCVGGATLASILRSLRYGAAVAASGLTAGPALETTVYPFITRHVALLGVDAVEMALADRQSIWDRLAPMLSPGLIDRIVASTVGLEELAEALANTTASSVIGRVLVDPHR